jgi:multiple sugar transport system substrate-binding protein
MKINHRKQSFLWAVLSLLVIASLLGACTGGGAPVATEEPEAVTPTEEPAAETEEAAEPTEEVAEPTTEAEPVVEETEQPITVETAENYSPSIPEPEEEVTLTFASWYRRTAQDMVLWEQLAAEFNRIHPNITIEYVDIPSDNMYDTLLPQIASGNPPDTAIVADWMVGSFSQNNALLNIDDYVAQSEIIDLEDYIPAFLNQAKVDESLFGLPIDGETTGLFYRTDRFEEAGLDPTKPPTTWEELTQYAEAMTNV